MRTKEFNRNANLEDRLHELSRVLAIADESISSGFIAPEAPVLFVVGAPRSGTTLSLQILAASGGFSYPTNLLARFYASPYIGGLTQEILTNPLLDFRGELLNRSGFEFTYSSAIGKTKGILSPNEFWYFWRRFIPNTYIRRISADEERKVDAEGLRAGVASIEKVFGKPFASKGMILQFNLALLQRIFPKALILFVTRHPAFNAQSLLEARVKQNGNKAAWYSAKPPGYETLLVKSPEEQVLGQVLMTNKAIRQSLESIPQRNWLEYDYEELCAKPRKWLGKIAEKCRVLGEEPIFPNEIPSTFESANMWRCNPDEQEKIESNYDELGRD